MLAVAYFAALLARSADRWTAHDADLDEIEDVAGLVELMREVPEDQEEEEEPDTSVLLLEQEEMWFAVIRLDADEDPRLFVSDVAAVSRSAYADLLLSADLLPVGPDGRPVEELAGVSAGAAGTSAGALDLSGRPAVDGVAGIGGVGGVAGIGGAATEGDEDEEVGGALTNGSRLDPVGLADEPAEHRPLHSGPAGDAELLADFGVHAEKLLGLCGADVVPADALGDLAEALGAADELEEVR